MPRLFTAIEIPPEVADRIKALRMPLPGARWIEPTDLHITLRFAGDIGNRTAEEFAHSLDGIEVPAFDIRLNGLGSFGGNDPRQLWAGVESGPQLEALARAHERAARIAGLPPEGRAFKPHVTIARLRHTPPDAVARVLGRIGAFRTEAFTVERFVLMSSKPKVGGGPYVVEEAYPLAGTAGYDEADARGW